MSIETLIFWIFYIPLIFIILTPFLAYGLYKYRKNQVEKIEHQREIEKRNAENRLAKKIAEEMKKAD